MNLPMNRDTLEAPETSAQEGLTGRSQFCEDLLLFRRYLESYFEKTQVTTGRTKIVFADLHSPCREIFALGLGVVVNLFVCW